MHRYLSALLIISACLGNILSADAADRNSSRPLSAVAEKPSPPNVLSIIPAQGEPGNTVILSGSGFTERTTVNLGTTQLPARFVGPQQISFEIPKLPAGLYALYIRREDNTTSRTYSFNIQALKPVADLLTPDTVTLCSSGREREVTVTGHNFLEKSQIIFDGAAIRGRFLGNEAISFIVPQVAQGLHQLQVKNQEDSISGVLGLMIDGRPEITGVSIKEEYVTSYNMLIEGRNFQQNSVLVVTEESSLEQAELPQLEVRRIRSGQGSAGERERLVYSGCNKLIYQRFPYSSSIKNIRIQVVNGNGEESSMVQVTAP